MQTPLNDDQAIWAIGAARPTGQRFAAYTAPGGVVIVDVESGRELRRVQTRAEIAVPVVFSPDGSVLLTIDSDKLATVWNAGQGTAMHSAAVEFNDIDEENIAITGANDVLAISAGGSISYVPLGGGKPRYQPHIAELKRAVFSLNDSLVAVATHGGAIQVMRAQSSTEGLVSAAVSYTLHGPSTDTRVLAFDPAGRRVAALYESNVVHVWDLDSAAVISSSRLPLGERVRSVQMDESGRYVIAREDSMIAVWDVRSRQRRGGVPNRVDLATGLLGPEELSMVASGRVAIVRQRVHPLRGNPSDSVLVFDIAAPQRTGALELPRIRGLAIDPQGDYIAYVLEERSRIVVRGVEGRVRFDTLDTSEDSGIDGRHIAFSAIGALFAYQPRSDRIVVWDAASRRVRDTLENAGGYGRLRWSSDGEVLANVESTTVVFWRRGDRMPFSRLQPTFDARFAALSPDGSLFAGSTSDRVSLFDVERGEQLGTAEFPGGWRSGASLTSPDPQIAGISFTTDGRALLVVRSDGTIDRLDVDPTSWAARACAIAASDAARARFTRAAPAGTPAPRRCFGESVRR